MRDLERVSELEPGHRARAGHPPRDLESLPLRRPEVTCGGEQSDEEAPLRNRSGMLLDMVLEKLDGRRILSPLGEEGRPLDERGGRGTREQKRSEEHRCTVFSV